ncbi:MAG TPA: hypothetical protein HPP94_13485 [Desulfuromonadales bacterium]|nr:hypothetical protein [Desulfuromonadales bacterium]
MKNFRKTITLALLVIFVMTASSSYASDNTLREVFEDAFYGAGIGALVGAAFMAFTKKPADHLENIGYGAAVGVLAGSAYGMAKSARALAQIDNGRIRIAVPMIVPDLVESPSTRQTTVMWHANILRGTFN